MCPRLLCCRAVSRFRQLNSQQLMWSECAVYCTVPEFSIHVTWIHSHTFSRQMSSISLALSPGGLSEFDLFLTLICSVFTEICSIKTMWILYLQVLTVKLDQQIEQNYLLSRVVCLASFTFYILRVNIYPVYPYYPIKKLYYYYYYFISTSRKLIILPGWFWKLNWKHNYYFFIQ